MPTYWINTDQRTHKYSPHNKWIDSGYAFTGGDIGYGQYFLPVTAGDTILMYANGLGIVAIGEALEKWDGLAHEPQLIYHDENEYRLRTNWFMDLRQSPFKLEQIKSSLGYIPSKAFVSIGNRALEIAIQAHHREKGLDPGLILPDELNSSETFHEGGIDKISVNRYERNPLARAKCIAFHGAKCSICSLEFRNVYGRIGSNFIHVHHIYPLSEIRAEYQVNPYTDLIPVCPNCHAMLHRKNPPYSADEIRKMMTAICRESGPIVIGRQP